MIEVDYIGPLSTLAGWYNFQIKSSCHTARQNMPGISIGRDDSGDDEIISISGAVISEQLTVSSQQLAVNKEQVTAGPSNLPGGEAPQSAEPAASVTPVPVYMAAKSDFVSVVNLKKMGTYSITGRDLGDVLQKTYDYIDTELHGGHVGITVQVNDIAFFWPSKLAKACFAEKCITPEMFFEKVSRFMRVQAPEVSQQPEEKKSPEAEPAAPVTPTPVYMAAKSDSIPAPKKANRNRNEKGYRASIRKEGNASGKFYGHTVVFSGKFSKTKSSLSVLAAGQGFNVETDITNNTTILVSNHSGSLKELEAQRRISRGQPVRIITEDEFINLLPC
jgi:hypothetical protein